MKEHEAARRRQEEELKEFEAFDELSGFDEYTS